MTTTPPGPHDPRRNEDVTSRTAAGRVGPRTGRAYSEEYTTYDAADYRETRKRARLATALAAIAGLLALIALIVAIVALSTKAPSTCDRNSTYVCKPQTTTGTTSVPVPTSSVSPTSVTVPTTTLSPTPTTSVIPGG